MSADALHLPANQKRPYRFPPGVRHNLLWEGLANLGPINPLTFFERLKREYGPVATYKVGRQRAVVVSDAELIREVLIVQNENFVKGVQMDRTRILLGNGMITAERADWRTQRQAAQPAFHRQRIRRYADEMTELTLAAAHDLPAGRPFDLAQSLMELALRIVAKTLFDTELEAEATLVAREINQIMGVYNFMMVLPAPHILLHVPFPQVLRFHNSRRRVDAVVNRMIAEHLTGPKRNAGDLLSMMIESMPEVDSPAAREQLRDQVVTIFLAGYETTANALAWTFRLLGENPHVEERLAREIASVLNGRTPTLDDLPQLKYAEMVLAESMRLYPPAWTQVRQALNDFQLGEYYLPAGTIVLMSQWVMHRSPEFFPEPLRFDPERFSPEAKVGRPKFAYFPFGGGARQCIGEAFAWMEGVLVLTTILQHWKFRLVPDQKFEPQPLITLRPQNGVQVIAERR